jgi:hypothetical protein
MNATVYADMNHGEDRWRKIADSDQRAGRKEERKGAMNRRDGK